MATNIEERIQRLEDIEAIRYLQAKYQRCLDTRDFAGLDECFDDDAVSSYDGGKISYAGKARIVDFLKKVMTSDMPSSHLIHGGEVDIEAPGRARAKWYLEDQLLHKKFLVKLQGAAVYDVEYAKVGGVWKISRIGYTRCYQYVERRTILNLFTLKKTVFTDKLKNDMKKLKLFLIIPFAWLLSGCEKQDSPTVPEDAVVAERIDIEKIDADDVPQIFKSENIEYHTVSVLNWPEKYPYLPAVDFAVAHNGTNLLIHYRVTEKRTLGTMVNDLDALYKDSCCEFFCMNEGDSLYYNIESNCLGFILMECGIGRDNRTVSKAENLQAIDRWASLGRESIGLMEQETHWELALVVPVAAFWRHDYGNLSGKTFLVNVYNCVGSGEGRQYVTWNPVDTPSPDFHRPEYFRRLYFAQ